MSPHYPVNNFQTPQHGLLCFTTPQPLPLSLFPVPHPLAMFSALWVLEPCFAPTLLCASLSTFLPGLISSPHTQSPALMPPAQTRLPELLSQAGPLFCSCMATCTYLVILTLPPYCNCSLNRTSPPHACEILRARSASLSLLSGAPGMSYGQEEFLNCRWAILGI